MSIPRYLEQHVASCGGDVRAAAIEWFRQTRYGLFLHFGLYSLLGRHEWVQWREKIRPGDYATLSHAFKADAFDAAAIADFAVACGMRYVNITTRHHDGFCLWPSKQTSFHVGNSPCDRDLVGELAQACDQRGLGLFCYYSHGRDWKHPHAPGNDCWGGCARPDYAPAEATYARAPAHDLNYYLDFMTAQVTELLRVRAEITSHFAAGHFVSWQGALRAGIPEGMSRAKQRSQGAKGPHPVRGGAAAGRLPRDASVTYLRVCSLLVPCN